MSLAAALSAYVHDRGLEHDDGCPEDDTCQCALVLAVSEALDEALAWELERAGYGTCGGDGVCPTCGGKGLS